MVDCRIGGGFAFRRDDWAAKFNKQPSGASMASESIENSLCGLTNANASASRGTCMIRCRDCRG